MANVVSANTVYVDTTGSITTKKNTHVYRIWFTPDAANDEILITDGSGGNNKFYARGATAKDTKEFRMDAQGLIFPNGIYITTLSSGAKAILEVDGV